MATLAMDINAVRVELIGQLCKVSDKDVIDKMAKYLKRCLKKENSREYIEKEELLRKIEEGMSAYTAARKNGKLMQMKTLDNLIDEL